MAAHNDASIADRGAYQNRIATAFLICTWALVALRIWTRTYIISSFGWDDATIILATMMFTVYCSVLIVIGAHGGTGHVTNVNQMQFLIKYTIVGEATYAVVILLLKISLGIFFMRIVMKKWQRNLVYAVISISTLSCLTTFFYVLFRCGTNVDGYLQAQLSGHCAPRPVDLFFTYQHATITTVTDWVFATLPVSILWRAGFDIRAKLSVGFILTLGCLGSIASIVRFFYVDGLTKTDDFYWNATNAAIWSTIEPGTGILAACLATLRPILRSLYRKAREITSRASASATGNTQSLRSMRHNRRDPIPPGSDEPRWASKSELSTFRTAESLSSSKGKNSIEKGTLPSRSGESTDHILEP